MAHWSCCFQLFSVLSPKCHLRKSYYVRNYDGVTVISGCGLSQSMTQADFFPQLPMKLVCCWPEATAEPRTDCSPVFRRLPWRRPSGRRRGWQRADHPALGHNCSGLSPRTRRSERARSKKSFFGGLTLYKKQWLMVSLTIYLLWWWSEAHRLTSEHSLRVHRLVSLPSFRRDNLESL